MLVDGKMNLDAFDLFAAVDSPCVRRRESSPRNGTMVVLTPP
jgi:hypothetical protein